MVYRTLLQEHYPGDEIFIFILLGAAVTLFVIRIPENESYEVSGRVFLRGYVWVGGRGEAEVEGASDYTIRFLG
jgi:hypothetical protein